MSSVKKAAAMGLTLTMVVGMLPTVAFAYSSKSGWVENSEGKWSYYQDGRKIKCDVRFDDTDGKYYLLNESGYRVTKKGWTTLKYHYAEYGDKLKESQRYYLGEGGEAKYRGWKKIKGKYYFFENSQAITNSIIPKFNEKDSSIIDYVYAVDKKGARITKKGWYHFKGYTYSTYDASKYTYDEWVYVKKGGKLAQGVKKIGKKKYVFSRYGTMVRNDYGSTKDGKKYYLADKNGVLISKKGWHKIKVSSKSSNYGGTYTYKSTQWVYVTKDGSLQTGLKKISGTYYYFTPSMQTVTTYDKVSKNGDYYTRYYFGRDGKCKKTEKIYYAT